MLHGREPEQEPEIADRITNLRKECFEAMNDDFNSSILIARLFEAVRIINLAQDDKEPLTLPEWFFLKKLLDDFLFNVLGMKDERDGDQHALVDGLMELILSIRQQSRAAKDWATSDQIRDTLQKLHVTVKDGKEGTSWGLE